MDYSPVVEEYAQYGKEAVSDWVLGYHHVYAKIAPLPGKRVLDYGCGVGKFARYLQARGADVTGVDISKEMIAGARSYEDDVAYYQLEKSGDLSVLPDGKFDIALLMFVIVHMTNKAEAITVLSEIYKQLVSGGRIVLLVGNWDVANGRNYLSYTFESYEELTSGMTVQLHMKKRDAEPLLIEEVYWSKDAYQEMLQQAGFTDVAFTTTTPMDDSYQWIDEATHPPLLIITAHK